MHGQPTATLKYFGRSDCFLQLHIWSAGPNSFRVHVNIQSISNLPFIRFHEDIQVRLLGAVPGDIIKITRPSPSSGVEVMYRVCIA